MQTGTDEQIAARAENARCWSRWIIYFFVWVIVCVPLVMFQSLPLVASDPTQRMYDAIEALKAENGLVIVAVDWDAGTMAENGPQTGAVVEHLFRKNLPFAIFGWAYPAGPELAEREIIAALAKRYDKVYGVDYVNLGYTTGSYQMLTGLARNIPEVVGEKDAHGAVLATYPIWQGIHDHSDISMVIDFTGSNTLQYWVQFWQGPYKVKLTYGCTGVIIPEAFPYLDAGQIKGVLKGLAGAAEYKFLLGATDLDSQKAYVKMTAQSLMHAYIILLIIIGNILYFRSRAAQRVRGD